VSDAPAAAIKHHHGDAVSTHGYDNLYRLTKVKYPDGASDS